MQLTTHPRESINPQLRGSKNLILSQADNGETTRIQTGESATGPGRQRYERTLHQWQSEGDTIGYDGLSPSAIEGVYCIMGAGSSTNPNFRERINLIDRAILRR